MNLQEFIDAYKVRERIAAHVNVEGEEHLFVVVTSEHGSVVLDVSDTGEFLDIDAHGFGAEEQGIGVFAMDSRTNHVKLPLAAYDLHKVGGWPAAQLVVLLVGKETSGTRPHLVAVGADDRTDPGSSPDRRFLRPAPRQETAHRGHGPADLVWRTVRRVLSFGRTNDPQQIEQQVVIPLRASR